MKKWKTVKNFKDVEDDVYQISYDGDVRIKKTKELLKKKIANKKHHPYYAVYLSKKTGKKSWVLVHQLVCAFFIKIPEKYKNSVDLVPDHIDNNGLNNHYTNLQWTTRSENIRNAWKRGEINTHCQNSPYAKITNDIAKEICECFQNRISYDEILSKIGLDNTKENRKLLIRIKHCLAYKNIVKLYDYKSWEKEYTPTQKDTIMKIPEIQRLIRCGYRNIDIVRTIWGPNLSVYQEKSKSQTVSDIRKGRIYKEFL